MNNSNETKERKKLDLKRITESRVFWMILSLLAASLLWMYVTTTEGVEVEKTLTGVKIEFLGADAMRASSDLIVTEQDRTTVNLTLSSTRRVLSKLTNSNVTATVNLSNVVADGRYSVSYDISYPAGVNANEITLVHTSSDVVNFYVDKLARKTIEVKGAFTGNTADGYLADESMVFDPLVVAISGPKTVISKVDHAFVAITREDVDRTLSYSTTYSLVDSDDNPIEDSSIQRETEEVTVTLNVLSTKEVPLDVTIIDGGGATRDANTRIDIEPKTIMLAGDASAIDSTTKLILGTINLSSFATDFSATYTIIPPNGTENMTGVTEATVRVSITGVATKSFSVNPENIVCINVPDGYTAENITQALNVTVRAPQEVLDQISEVNLRAVADLSNLGTNASGVFTPTVEIKIDGFPEAGCVGEYKIYITLKEKH